MPRRILVADIGGTNSRFAIFEGKSACELASQGQQPKTSKEKSIKLVESKWLKTAEAESFYELFSNLRKLDQNSNESFFNLIDAVCVAAAGPVRESRYCTPPNIPWTIDILSIKSLFQSAELFLINDFLAQAFACIGLVGESARTIKDGNRLAGTVAVLGPGTGLGKALIASPDSKSEVCFGIPSEGGHASFPVETPEEYQFLQFLQDKLKSTSVSFEHVISGRGLSFMYEFLTGDSLSPMDVSSHLSGNPQEAVSISVRRLYRRSLGRACKCFALECFSTGGLFITGGVIAKNPHLAEGAEFIDSILNSDTQIEFLRNMPVFLVDNEESGLWGAADYAFESLLRSTSGYA